VRFEWEVIIWANTFCPEKSFWWVSAKVFSQPNGVGAHSLQFRIDISNIYWYFESIFRIDISNRYFESIFRIDISNRYFESIFWINISNRYFESIGEKKLRTRKLTHIITFDMSSRIAIWKQSMDGFLWISD
jgi:hypothetical protein